MLSGYRDMTPLPYPLASISWPLSPHMHLVAAYSYFIQLLMVDRALPALSVNAASGRLVC